MGQNMMILSLFLRLLQQSEMLNCCHLFHTLTGLIALFSSLMATLSSAYLPCTIHDQPVQAATMMQPLKSKHFNRFPLRPLIGSSRGFCLSPSVNVHQRVSSSQCRDFFFFCRAMNSSFMLKHAVERIMSPFLIALIHSCLS